MNIRHLLVGTIATLSLLAASCSGGETVATNVSGGGDSPSTAVSGSSSDAVSIDVTGGSRAEGAGDAAVRTDPVDEAGDVPASGTIETDPDIAFPTAEGGPLKVGFVTTLSGGAAYMGEDLRDGMLLALDLDRSQPIDIIAVDDGQDPERGLAGAEGLLNEHDVDLMTGVVFPNIALAMLPSILERDVIYIAPNAGPAELAGSSCHQNYFNTGAQTDSGAEAIGQHLSNLGVDEAFIMAPDYRAGRDVLDGFKRTFQGAIIGETYTPLGATDYSAALAEIEDIAPQALFVFYPGAMGISFLTQYDAAGLRAQIPLYATSANADDAIVDIVGEPALGLINSSTWSNDLENDANLEFVSEFGATYGRNPTLFAAQGYDTGRLVLSALKQVNGNSSDTAALREALRAADFDSVRGDFAFGRNQHAVQSWHIREVVTAPAPGDLTNRTLTTVLRNHADSNASDCG